MPKFFACTRCGNDSSKYGCGPGENECAAPEKDRAHYLKVDHQGTKVGDVAMSLETQAELANILGVKHGENVLAVAKKLRGFKAYVHERLDKAGIEKNPKGPHSLEGCRIGDRLDILLGVPLRFASDGQKKATGYAATPSNWREILEAMSDDFEDQILNLKQRLDPLVEEAVCKVRGKRQEEYGDKLTNFTDIANLENAAHNLGGADKRTAETVAIDNICQKLARLRKSPDHYDTLIDLVGYIICYRDIRRARNPEKYASEEIRFAAEKV